MKNSIQIMLIEDNPAYRKGICCAIENTDGMKLSRQFGTAEIALRSIPAFEREARPNLVLLDLNLPGMSGLDALPEIKALLPEAKVIILTQSDLQADVLRAIELGANGYLLKASSIPQLLQGIQTVHDGGATLDPGLASLIMNTLNPGKTKKPPAVELSRREHEVLALIAEGSAQKQIAAELDISVYTVSEYIANIYKKLNVPNAPAAIAKAYRTGILPSSKE
jgi:two-component system nitrate/nitrite response regulator NarL